MLPIIWRETALDSLATILDYIVEHSEIAADRLQGDIEKSILRLSEYPYLGKLGRVPSTRELVLNPNYVVVYEITLISIEVLLVLHTRQQYP